MRMLIPRLVLNMQFTAFQNLIYLFELLSDNQKHAKLWNICDKVGKSVLSGIAFNKCCRPPLMYANITLTRCTQ